MTADRSAFTNGMSTDQTPTADEIIAVTKREMAKLREHNERMERDAKMIQCEWCKPAAVWKNGILWLCPHYIRAVNELSKDSRELSISEHMAVQVSGLRIGEMMSREFAELMLGELNLKWGYL